MIVISEKKNCCGCSACVNICPQKCIDMKRDIEGFEYPSIIESKCINCSLCEKVCPINNSKKIDDRLLESYVAYSHNDDIRLNSSSGGIFSLIAENILDKKGVVFGASFDSNFDVCHTMIESKSDLYKLRGSKYTQSKIGNTYEQCKQILDSGSIVLYTGTECQISGLKSYLKKEYENLYTVDVLCHGVPSPKLWRKYLEYQEQRYNSSIKQIFFRDKTYGWKDYSINVKFDNNDEYKNIFKNDYFMKLFLKDISLRPSCYDCKFKDINRVSDITLGDCWGIENYMPDMDDDKGTSVVLLHSEKGVNLFNLLKDKMIYKQEFNVDKILAPSADSRKSVFMHPRRNDFFIKLCKNKSIEQLVKTLEPTKYQVIKQNIRGIYYKFKCSLKRIVKY